MIGCVGADELRGKTVENLQKFGVDLSGVRALEGVSTGAAFITVDRTGQNSIVLSPGANALVTPEMIEESRDVIAGADMLLVQMEIPMNTVERAVEIARKSDVRVVVNPAPAVEIRKGSPLWKSDVFVVNEHEAEFYTGQAVTTRQDASAAGRALRELGPENVIVTLGESGSVAVTGDTGEDVYEVEALKVEAMDTTAAGDTYIGGFCVQWLRTGDIASAMRFGSAAAALSVQRFGAQSSIPDESELPGEL
jgi:ribokinase